jgi:hypothetical protein|tara:strand:+ start:30 stop:239 length:210 start_codon:yes stop_codon:yes gene_type:complete
MTYATTALGWGYPAGAQNDSNAPYAQGDCPADYCDACDSYGHDDIQIYVPVRFAEQWCTSCIEDHESHV